MPEQIEDDGVGQQTVKPTAAGQGKKPYRSPRLVVYGDLRRLTLMPAQKRGTSSDGGGIPKTKLSGAG